MKHVPHLFVPGPWEKDRLTLSSGQVTHLERVLRLEDGAELSYTDGSGTLGSGIWDGGTVIRDPSSEVEEARPSSLVMAVAPPTSRERVRFLVEKLGELGVEKLAWLATTHGGRRLPKRDKLQAWAVSALEQSRGAWLMEISSKFVEWDELEGPLVVCTPTTKTPAPAVARTVAVGPEGGLAPEEIPASATKVDLGRTILRVETAAIVAAARFR